MTFAYILSELTNSENNEIDAWCLFGHLLGSLRTKQTEREIKTFEQNENPRSSYVHRHGICYVEICVRRKHRHANYHLDEYDQRLTYCYSKGS